MHDLGATFCRHDGRALSFRFNLLLRNLQRRLAVAIRQAGTSAARQQQLHNVRITPDSRLVQRRAEAVQPVNRFACVKQGAHALDHAEGRRAVEINLRASAVKVLHHLAMAFFICPTAGRRAVLIVKRIDVSAVLEQQVNDCAVVIDGGEMERRGAVFFGVQHFGGMLQVSGNGFRITGANRFEEIARLVHQHWPTRVKWWSSFPARFAMLCASKLATKEKGMNPIVISTIIASAAFIVSLFAANWLNQRHTEKLTDSQNKRIEDLKESLDNRINDLKESLNNRIQALEEKLDQRFKALEEKFEVRLTASEEKFELRFKANEDKFEARFDTVTFRLVAIEGKLGELGQRVKRLEDILFNPTLR